MCDNHTTARHFYKCPLCLCVAAVDAQHQQAIDCRHCSQAMEHMGRVQRDRLVKDKIQCACDFRCIDALGPKCDCQCGGKNHGSGKVVFVTVDAGKLIAETTPTARQVMEAKEYRATLETAVDELRRLTTRQERGEYLPSDEFQKLCRVRRQIAAARKLRSHAGRMNALAVCGHKPQRLALAEPRTESAGLVAVTSAKTGCLF